MPTVGSLPSRPTNSGTHVDLLALLSRVSMGVDARDETFECRKIAINGILKNNCEISQESLLNITFASLSTVFPSLGRGAITAPAFYNHRALLGSSMGKRRGLGRSGICQGGAAGQARARQ